MAPRRRHRDRSAATADLPDWAFVLGPEFVNVREFSDDDLRAEWERRRERLLANTDMRGGLPWAWWAFEQRRDPPRVADEADVLAALGVTDATAAPRAPIDRATARPRREKVNRYPTIRPRT